jgi:hypothetical protein
MRKGQFVQKSQLGQVDSREDLESPAEELEDKVTDQSGGEPDDEVDGGKDIVQSDGEGFAPSGGAIELSHEQIGIEEEDDEDDLDRSAQDGRSRTRRMGIRGHFVILAIASVIFHRLR